MARLVKQVSIESPTHKLKECIFNFETPMPEIPPAGARVKVCVARTLRIENGPFFVNLIIFLCIHYVGIYANMYQRMDILFNHTHIHLRIFYRCICNCLDIPLSFL